jgi:DNA invertase Pin-like site-specific DNA recombinase
MSSRILISTSVDRLQHTVGMKPTLAIPYHRFSHAKQETGSSLERQREITSAAIVANEWSALPYAEDRGRSAWHGHHLEGELGRVTATAQAGGYLPGTVIVAERLDRFSRQGYETFTAWVKAMIEAGMRVYTCDDRKLYDAASIHEEALGSKVNRMVMADGARAYVSVMRGLVIDGIRNRQAKSAELGRPTSTKKTTFDVVPGYFKWEGETLVVVPDRAEIICDIYQWSADGMGAASIARRLNGQKRWAWGRKNPQPWQPSSIYKLLQSPAVEGDFIPTVNGEPQERIVGYYFGLRIVDADLVKRARDAAARRSKMKGAGPSADFINIFQGVSRCGGCYGRTHVQKCKDQKGVVRRYFRCDRASRNAGCRRKEMHPYEVFEAAALNQMLHLALDDRFFSRPDDLRPLALEVANLEKMVADQKAKARRLSDRIFSTDDPDPIWIEQQADLRPLIRNNENCLEEARRVLADARGTVTSEVHLQRVLEVREAMRSEDRNVAMAAARSVRDAVSSVVDLVMTDVGPDGEKSMLVFMAGTLITFRVSDKSGRVSNYKDRTALALRGQPDLPLFKAATSIHRGGVEGFAALVRRVAATSGGHVAHRGSSGSKFVNQ